MNQPLTSDNTKQFLDKHNHKIHWKHWVMHSGTVILTFSLGVLADVGYLHWEKRQPRRVWWMNQPQPDRWSAPVAAWLPTRTGGYEIQLGFCEDGTAVWRAKQ